MSPHPTLTPPITSMPTSRAEVLALVRHARQEQGLTLASLATELGVDRVWLAAALEGQHPVPEALALALLERLDLPAVHASALTPVPMRGSFATLPPADPTVARLYEALQVYGPALKTLIHEEFGDGIMSAINFRLELKREPHPDGDRVHISLAGKFLPYHWATPDISLTPESP